MYRRNLLVPAVACALAFTASASLAANGVRVRPGPSTMSDEERALEPDPELGIDQGVILVRELQVDDDYGLESLTRFHQRVKIFSDEARSLGDFEIELNRGEVLTAWWGKTILPDGAVLELRETDLEEQEVARVGRYKVRALKAALPGIVPGAVIDYGYAFKTPALNLELRYPLLREWPILRFAYGWKPSQHVTSGYRIYPPVGVEVSVEKQRHGGFVIVGRDWPAVPDEPHMPPDHMVRGIAMYYYADGDEGGASFWKRKAKKLARASRQPLDDALVQEAVTAARARSGGDPQQALAAAYDWIAANVENPLFEDVGKERKSISAGSELAPLDHLFMLVARQLGVDAHPVLAADRRGWELDPAVMVSRQVSDRFVAVGGGEGGESWIFADPDSGLPFGAVPYWASGGAAMLATPKGVLTVGLPSSRPEQNITRTETELHVMPAGDMHATWQRTSHGQAALRYSQFLADVKERERRHEEVRLCGGGSGDLDIDSVESALDYPPVVFRLSCDASMRLPPLEDVGVYSVAWAGPWVPWFPRLPLVRRVNPVDLDFPRVDITEVEVVAPEGFGAGETPETIRLESDYGKYRLEFTAHDQGYRVERALALYPVIVPAAEYEALAAFLADVGQADGTRVEFLLNEESGS